ncbi:MAG: hypothetical protein ABI690_15320 [Chloroflexota bacterium]
MHKFIGIGLIIALLLAVLPISAQDVTAEPTSDATLEVTTEVTLEPTLETTSEATSEATMESTSEATMEATSEVTAETTVQITPSATLSATAAPIVPGDGAGISVADQIVLNGMVMIDNVTAPKAGFVSIFATDSNGANAHLVGLAPVQAGTTDNLSVPIDGAMATPFLTAQVHVDDNQPGVFEFGHVTGADMPLTGADAGFPAARAFKIAGIFSFDQQPVNNTVVIASVVSEIGGWLVIHAEANGQPGAVLGQTLLKPGTNPAVKVTLSSDGLTPVVWPMLHVDDTTIGTYEYGTVANADLPIFLGDVTATRPMKLTDAPTVFLADGSPLAAITVPSISASPQTFDSDPNAGLNFMVDNVISVGPGFVDVHADDDGHPSGSLGHTAVLDGQNANVAVMLLPEMNMPITPVVWPMLHSDTNNNGTYDYLMIPGTDLAVVYNGDVVTQMVTLSGSAVATGVPVLNTTPVPTTDLTSTATATGTTPTDIPTPEASVEATSEATVEATSEMTAEPTAENTAESTAEMTEAPTAEATIGTDVTETPTLTATATP